MTYYHRYLHYIQFFDLERIQNIINKTVEESESDVCYFFDMCWEGFNFKNWYSSYQFFFDQIRLQKPTAKIFVLVNSKFKKYSKNLQLDSIDDVLYLDYFLYRTVSELLVRKVSPVCNSYQPSNDKFLCLGGRVKQERIELFQTLYQAKLLDRAVYSLRLENSHHDNNQIIDLPNNESNVISTIIKNSNAESYYSGDGMYYKHLYDQCLFQVVVENSVRSLLESDGPWITEKTWMAIVNRNPFIIYGDAGTLEVLQNMGFRTFENYLAIPDYQRSDRSETLEILKVNIKHWLKTINRYQQNICNDVEHNFQNLIRVFNLNKSYIDNFVKKHQLICDIDCIMPTDFNYLNQHWEIFYNQIRDYTWPKSTFFRDIYTLPQDVIKELFNHDYQFLKSWPLRLQEFENLKMKLYNS